MQKLLLYKIVRPIITFLFKAVYRPTIIGKENILNDESLVLAGNHTSNLDCLLLISSTKRTIRFLAKDDLVKGIKKYIFLAMGIIPVNRKIHNQEALYKSIELLNENNVIGIFPEGTINRSEKPILPFKYGAVKMSKETKSNIVPFVITGKYKIFQKNIKIEFLKPYKVTNDILDENKKLEDMIVSELERKKK